MGLPMRLLLLAACVVALAQHVVAGPMGAPSSNKAPDEGEALRAVGSQPIPADQVSDAVMSSVRKSVQMAPGESLLSLIHI